MENTKTKLRKPSIVLCEFCGQHIESFIIKVPFLPKKQMIVNQTCRCIIEKRKKEDIIARNQKIKEILYKRGFETGKYSLMTFDRWNLNRDDMQVIKKVYDYINIINKANNRNWLYMHGENGLGKTHMAIASARQIAANNLWEPCIVRWSEYCTLIQQSWHDQSLRPDWHFTRQSRILVLDDIDKKPSTQWALGQLYEILDIRDINNLPTIITANRSISELSEFWSKSFDTKDLSRSIISRIMGQIFKVIYFKGEDYRFLT